MFDNHIQNIWVAQRKRGGGNNNEIEKGATRMEEKEEEKWRRRGRNASRVGGKDRGIEKHKRRIRRGSVGCWA